MLDCLNRWKLDSSRRRNCVFTYRLCLPKIELSEVEIDSLMFFNVPLFIFLNEIQGRHLLRRIPRASYRCFNPYVSFGDRSHLYIIDYFSIICICDLSNCKFQFDLLVCGHLVLSNATIKKVSCYLSEL